MAGTYQDWLDLYTNADQGKVYSDLQRQSQSKQTQVDQAAQKKQQELRRLTDPRGAAGVFNSQQNNQGLDSASEMERDVRTMTGPELLNKYGPEQGALLLASRNEAGLEYDRIQGTQRTGTE